MTGPHVPGAGDPNRAADTAELARLDQQITALQARAIQAHQAFVAADAAVRAAVGERTAVIARLQTRPAPVQSPPFPALTSPAATPHATPPSVLAPAPVAAVAAPRPGTSTRTVQNVLFILGGLLLGTAAVAFTAVAWTTFGVGGRAAILAVVTLVALGIPLLALARKLRATAETFAAIGLLLVVLDGYAAWYVNLGHVQSMPGTRYAGIVVAVTAIVGYGYRLATGLIAPAFMALIAAQPAIILLLTFTDPRPAGVSLAASATAALNVFALWRGRSSGERRLPAGAATAFQALCWIFLLTWLAYAGFTALIAEASGGTVADLALAGLAMVVAALVLLGAALVGRLPLLVPGASAVLVVAIAIATVVLANEVWPNRAVLLLGLVALLLSAAVLGVNRLLPAAVRPGPRAGAVAVAGLIGVGLTAIALFSAAMTIRAAYPLWHATLSVTGPHPPVRTWQLPVALVLLAIALILSVPQWTWVWVAVGAGVLAVLALPSAVGLPWWAPAVLSLIGAGVAFAASFVGRWRRLLPGLGGAVLIGNAVLTSGARPWLTALVLTGTAVLGLTTAAWSMRARPVTGTPAPDQPARPSSTVDLVGGLALLVGLVAVPPAIGSSLVAGQVVPWWSARFTVLAVALPLLAVVLVRRSAARAIPVAAAFLAAVASAVVWPWVAVNVGAEPVGVYAGVSLVLIAAALVAASPARPAATPAVNAASASAGTSADAAPAVTTDPSSTDAAAPAPRLPAAAGVPWPGLLAAAGIAAIPGAVALAVVVIPAVVTVAVAPYEWLTAIWTGRPDGVGLAPDGTEPVRFGDAAALALLAIACATAIFAVTRRWRSALGGLGVGGPTAILVALTAGNAPWPAVPAATLLLGLMLGLAAALGWVSHWRAVVAVGQSIVYIGAGIAASTSPMRTEFFGYFVP